MMMLSSLIPQFGPLTTPKSIKVLAFLTAAISLLAALVQTVFVQFDLFPNPKFLFGLNWWGMQQGFIWQPFTYLFIQGIGHPISVSSLLTLAIMIYLLWIIGSDLVEKRGSHSFLLFYFFIGIAAGLITLLLMPMTGKYASLAGPGASLLAMLIAWAMAFPDNEYLLFFLFPIKAKWLVAGVAGALLLINFSAWDIPHFILYLSAILLAYGYGAACWGWRSPFACTARFDRWLAMGGSAIRQRLFKPSQGEGKIIDIQTGRPADEDEAFVEQMLAKISKYGERSLSWSERQRMKKISEKMKDKLNH